MGTDGDKDKHNPDSENLRSLLKKTSKREKKRNHVVFNENKNEFFEADYIILIREECEYDEEDDEGVCTCSQHEMVRLKCCEPNCNCSIFDEYEQTPQSPKFAPPIEFVDNVTLSPPEGYKDMELEEFQLFALQQIARKDQRAVCRECSASHEAKDEEGQFNGNGSQNTEDIRKIDESQQTTPTTPTNYTDPQQYTIDTKPFANKNMTEGDEENIDVSLYSQDSTISSILKGGKLWKQQSLETNYGKTNEINQQNSDVLIASDEDSSKRSVRFIESEGKQDNISESIDKEVERETKEKPQLRLKIDSNPTENHTSSSMATSASELTLSFNLGNHILISNNSLKPNSAVRQLFPCTESLTSKPIESDHPNQYLVTSESLRAFEETKRCKLPQIIQCGDTHESIKRAIERNSLRRSLIRYEPRSRKIVQKTDNSLVERIKQLTCDINNFDENQSETESRTSPTGEETHDSVEALQVLNKNQDKSFSPSSSSTASSSSSSVSSTYKKLTDIFGKREKPLEINDSKIVQTLPDIGGPHNQDISIMDSSKMANENRKQFLSNFAPLTACVSMRDNPNEYYQLSNPVIMHTSVASTVSTEYSLEDINEGPLGKHNPNKQIAPDVLAGTPLSSESGEELAVFVEQGSSRIERIKKKYQPEPQKEEDDEHDDYGFNRRPSVRGIKQQFESTENLQQLENSPHYADVTTDSPYYLNSCFNSVKKNINQSISGYQYNNVMEDQKANKNGSLSSQDNIYQECKNQRCVRETYRTCSTIGGVEVGCKENYQCLTKVRGNRPLSPPPQEYFKQYHQTMVYIPYNNIDGYQQVVSTNPYYKFNNISRVSNQNEINKRYTEPIYQQRIQYLTDYSSNPKMFSGTSEEKLGKALHPNTSEPLLLTINKNDPPSLGQFYTAKSTQTTNTCLSTCNYNQSYIKYRAVGPVLRNDGNGPDKSVRYSFPLIRPRYISDDKSEYYNISSEDNPSHHGQLSDEMKYSSAMTNYALQSDYTINYPTKPRLIERGVPEGADSISPQEPVDVIQNMTHKKQSSNTNPKPFYAMNV